MAELGLLTFSWVLVDFGVSYKNGGPLLHQEMLRLWAERYAQRGSCSVSGFWGIPRWAGGSSFQHCRAAAASWLRLPDIVDPVEIGCDLGVYSWGTRAPTAMAPAHDAHYLPQIRVIHQGPTAVTLAGVHATLQDACTQHLLGNFPLVCILCIASSSVNDLD